MSRHEPADHLEWRTTQVDGRRVRYGTAGDGLPVLFLHGWALGSHAYKRDLKRLVRMGCRVYAPNLPGFGGSTDLDGGSEMADYAAWATGFLDALGVEEPVLTIGHSFGGAVAVRLTHDFPERVAHLVLISAIGAGMWTQSGERTRTLAERPLWHWALLFPIDIALAPGAIPTVSAILEDAVPNMLHNPIAVWRAGMLARRAICHTLGIRGRLVPGRHSWLLADPDAFAEFMAPPVIAASAARTAHRGLSSRPA
jgi:pimeloyl-ACP methyl ester carboxylesterase